MAVMYMIHTEPSLAVDKMAVLLNGTIVEKYSVIWFLWSEGVKKIPQENVSTIWRRMYWYEKESVLEDGKIPEWQKMHHWWRLLWAAEIMSLCAPKNILHSWHWTFMEPINQYLWDVNNCIGKSMFLP